MHSNYIGLTIFGVLIVVGIGAFIFFKIRWGAQDRAEKSMHEKRIEEEKNEEHKQQSQG